MSIRMTNKIMLNNSMTNINRNKVYLDKVTTQMALGQKISRASEDPIIAIRALRIKNNQNELSQYKANISNAQGWMRNTETALNNIYTCVEQMSKNCSGLATGTYSSAQYQALLDEMNSLREQIYAEGNVQYETRSLLTGYKTNMNLAFSEQDTAASYEITQNIKPEDLKSYTHISGNVTLDKSDILANTNTEYDATGIKSNEVYRIRLAYSDLTALNPAQLTYTDANGTAQTINLDVVGLSDAAYAPAQGKINFIQETGELIVAADLYDTIQKAQDMKITYQKTGFNEGELYPEHYFDCKNLNTGFEYKNTNVKQTIDYRVNFNQVLQVNVEASDVFDHSIGRDMDDIIAALTDYVNITKTISEIETMIDDNQYKAKKEYLNSMLDAAKKQQTYMKDKFSTMGSSMLTSFKGYMDSITKATTDLASRQSRLSLTSERVETSISNMDELAASNIGVEESDIIIEQKEAKVAYEAALTATSNIMGMSLLDFLR